MNSIPLAEKLRPKDLREFVGQKHIVGKEGILGKLLTSQSSVGDTGFPSFIFWGPPGSGKTTLARIIANELKREFFEFSAVNTKTKDIEKVFERTRRAGDKQLTIEKKGLDASSSKHRQPIIFIDEIHRFNKAQQDKLLPHVEKGDIVLIGATTENPSFEVISPLLSRTRVLTLNQLSENELEEILMRAKKEIGASKINKNAQKFLIESANGDARVLLNVFEISVQLSRTSSKKKNQNINITDIEEALQRRQLGFDKRGEEYYNIISSYIKSMRASNVDAALYYLARMVEGGQDPLYIARRMVVFASEDVGMAQPTALVVANEVFRACETIGYPECAINLAHGTTYLAKAKKDRSAYDAYFRAVDDVKRYGNLPTPLKIRNAPTKLMKKLGYGKGYNKYTKESLLPDKLKGKRYYNDKL